MTRIDYLQEVVAKALEQRILVVEDDPMDRQLLQWELANLKIPITYTATLAEALKELNRTPYSLCLLDLRLPDSPLDPVELVDTLQTACPTLQIIILTGALQDDKLQKILEKKVANVLLKPLRIHQLKDIIE